MKRASLLLIAAALIAAAPSPEPAIQAERDFAAAVARDGIKRGFLAFAAPGAFMFAPGRKSVTEIFADAPDRDEGPTLEWWPEFAGMAQSGDFGFTTGSASVPTRYFTVWRKQADGSWKWIYDGGVPLAAKMAPAGDKPVLHLAPATARSGSATRALAEIAPLERGLATASAKDARSALLPFLVDQALVGSPPAATYPGSEGQKTGLAQRPAQLALGPLGGDAASSGDMAFTYGTARWAERSGHYVRIWQKHRSGWRVAVDLLIPQPPAPALPS